MRSLPVKIETTGAPPLVELEDYLLLAPVLLLPWAFGGVEIWAFRSAASLLVAAACVSLWKRGWPGWGWRPGNAWLLPAFLLALWGALQLLPLPPAALRVVSPEAYRLYDAAFPGYDGSPVADPLVALEEQALGRLEGAHDWPPAESPAPAASLSAPDCLDRSWRSISIRPSATQERLAWYVALLLGFVVARQRVRDKRRFRAYRWALFGLFTLLALFSLVQLQLWNGKVYWVRRVLLMANPYGPYFNPTNLAGVMELAVPALAGFAWSRLRRTGRQGLHEPRFLASAVGAIVCLVAGLLAASKLAAVLLVVGLAALGWLCARTARQRVAVVGLAVLLTGVGALLFSGTRLGERVALFLARSQDASMLEGRLVVWQSGLQLFGDFPLTGAGFGSFAETFARYVPAGAATRWNHAHNDYLELVLEGGLVAAVLVVWLSVGYVRRAGKLLRRSRPLRPSRVGLAVGIVLLSAHAFFDFNHQVPANALLWVTCCAMLLPEQRAAREKRP
jgi:O-antigen ligase